MKKYGKYETRPVAGAKQPKMKSALLQTYFVSLLCLVLCMTMFFGTSYAWFTSEVNNGTNEIYIGTLDVGMFKVTSGGPQDLAVVGNTLFDNTIRWEPGYTAMETIQIVNDGDLAFKYVLNFTDGAATDGNGTAADLKAIAKYFDVWVYDQTGKSAPAPANYDAITAEGSGWVNAGTLEQLLNGQSVLNGVMQKPQQGETAPAATYVIALHMNPLSNSNEAAAVMGKKVSLSVKLVAYQMVAESDGHILVATAKDLADVFATGGKVTLVSDIELPEAVNVGADTTVILDLNGHVLSAKNETAAASCAINNKGTLTIKNGTVTYQGVGDINYGYGTNTINNTGKLVIDGATIVNTTDSGSSVAIDCSAGAELIVKGGEIKSVKNAIRLCPFGSGAIKCTINDGTITGARAVQIHLPGSNAADAPEISLTINGGTFTGTSGQSVYSYSYGQSFNNVTVAINGGIYNNDVIFGGGTNKVTKETVTITGGTFNGNLGRYVEDNGSNGGWLDIAKP